MDATQLEWLLLSLAMGANGALAWRQGATGRARAVIFGALAGLWGVLFGLLNGLDALTGWPQFAVARRWGGAALGGYWLLVAGFAALRLRKHR
jgi:hypothetical protein